MVQEVRHSPTRVVSDNIDVLLILTHHLHAHSGTHAIIDVNEIVHQHSTVIPNLFGAYTEWM